MDNQYSSFYLYRKYEVIGDELVDLGITSIDAEGTLEPVIKEECDPECGCPPPEPIYRWVQTEDTVCVGEEPPKEKIVLFEGSQSFTEWQAARFSKSEGFLDVYFERNKNDYLDYLYENNEPLYVEFSSVPDSGTLQLQTGTWGTIFDAAAEVSTSEPLQIYITDNTMYNDIYDHDLALVDMTGGSFTITSVYFYK